MDKTKQWALTVSAVSIISGVLLSVIPKNSHKNLFKLITGIILIYALMQPFLGGNIIDFNIKDFLSENYAVSEDLDKYALSSMVSSAEKAIEDLFYTEAEKQTIDCDFECRCQVINQDITVEEIKVRPQIDNSSKEKIQNFAQSMGFSASVLRFEGERYE